MTSPVLPAPTVAPPPRHRRPQPTRFTDISIDAVVQAADLVAIVQEHVRLQRSGAQLKGLCPFHQEKTPSLLVHPEKQVWRCHGCGASGNAVSFVERIHDWKFPQAIRWLSDRFGVPLDGRKIDRAQMERAMALQQASDAHWARCRREWTALLMDCSRALRQAQEWGRKNTPEFAAVETDKARDAWRVIAEIPAAMAELERRMDWLGSARPDDLVRAFVAERRG